MKISRRGGRDGWGRIQLTCTLPRFTVYGIQYEPQPVTLTAGRPIAAIEWNLTWTESPNATGCEIHES